MGRRSGHNFISRYEWGGRGASLRDYDGVIEVHHVAVNRQGYTRNGAYVGVGEPFYVVFSEDYEVNFNIRASDKTEAKAMVQHYYPKARVK